MEIKKSNLDFLPVYKNKHINNLLEYFLVGLLYILLTAVLTYPVLFKIKTDIPGTGEDSFQWMRILWYTKIAVQEADLTTFTHDNLLFYPNGIESMPFPSAFNQMLYLLLSPFLELHVIYTILWLLTFVIGAFGAYLLVKYLTYNEYAAFIAGIVFAFSPYHFSRGLCFFGAATIQWIPFCALFLMRTVKEGGIKGTEGGIKNTAIAGVFFVLVAMSDLQYLIFMGIFAGLVFLYDFYMTLSAGNKFTCSMRKLINKYILFIGVVFLGVLPLTFNEILIALSNENFLKPDASEILKLSNDLMTLFLPSHLHPLFGQFTADLYFNLPSWHAEKVNFIGYVVLGLTAISFLKARKNPDVKFWLVSTLFFTILSLGPVLHFNGIFSFTDFNLKIPLPHQLLYNTVPFLKKLQDSWQVFLLSQHLGIPSLQGMVFRNYLSISLTERSLSLQ